MKEYWLHLDKIWDYIVENGIATDEELKLVTCINGYNAEALNSVIYARTTYHSMEQYIEGEEDTKWLKQPYRYTLNVLRYAGIK